MSGPGAVATLALALGLATGPVDAAGGPGPAPASATPPATLSVPSPAPSPVPPGALAWEDAVAPAHAVRLALAQRLGTELTARGLNLLYLLAHDPDPEVAEAAAASAVVRCAAEADDVCLASLAFFLRRSDPPASWTARAALRGRDPAAAVAHASPAFKLDTVSLLASTLDDPRGRHQAAVVLRRLAEDPNLEVQHAASAALMGLER